jgi:hypothetical protein
VLDQVGVFDEFGDDGVGGVSVHRLSCVKFPEFLEFLELPRQELKELIV